jgi:hypothetical protein
MKRKDKRRRLTPTFGVTLALCLVGAAYQASDKIPGRIEGHLVERAMAAAAAGTDDAAARAAFEAAAPVFFHPRCMNCHPGGDEPLQGDDSRVHAQNVKRGTDGRGRVAMRCSTCHQSANLPGENMPPGNPNWHLPPAKTKMIFQGLTAGQLCRQFKDSKQNGGKTLTEIIEHVSSDSLVLWGWNPGDGRTLPPLSHADFAAKMREWENKGAACPD